MISTFIVENYFLVRVVLLLASIASVVLAGFLSRRGAGGRKIAAAITALAFVVIVGLTLVPDKVPLDRVNCSFDASQFFYDYFNMVLFFLPALFAVVATRRPLVVLASGIVLSAAIEFVQAVSPILGRRCDIGDWLANSLGTVAGVLLAVLAIKIAERLTRRGQREEPPARPS